MTTRTYTSVIDHTGNAGYIAWRDEFFSNIIAAGLVQTADTGQYTIGSGTRPGTNTVGDNAIVKLPDGSLFFKIETGTGSAATTPQIWITAGEGSNGSGTLTGQLSTRAIVTNQAAPLSTSATYTTYICVTNDFFGFLWKAGGKSTTRPKGMGNFTCAKTVDGTGAATSTGYMVQYTTNASNGALSQCVRRAATAATYVASISFCVVPGTATTAPANSLDASGNVQAYTHWGYFPTVLPMLHTCTVRDADVTELNTFSVILVGSSAHTYLNLGLQGGLGEATQQTTAGFTNSLAMLWE